MVNIYFEELCTLMLAGEATEAQATEFEKLLQNQENEKYWNQVNSLWNNIPDLKTDNTFSTEDAWNNILGNIKVEKGKSRQLFSFSRIAAAIAILLVASVAIYFYVQPRSLQYNTVAASNSQQSINLEDGSKIKLSQNSTLEYATVFKEHRMLKLKGSAFFIVAKDSLHPFKVESEAVQITVLGTAFSVENLENKTTRIFVEHGKVKVNTKLNKEIVLTNNQSIIVDAQGQLIENKTAEMNAELTGVGKFNNSKISDAVRFLEKQYNIKINLVGTSDEPISFPFNCNKQSAQEILEVLAFTVDAQLIKEGENYTLKLK